MSLPFFSVIIPVFNRARVIGRAIDSVLGQSFSDWELIIIDDGSSDALAAALEPYQSNNKLRLYRTQNQGVSKARNFAAKMAQGKWLAFLDSDDEWLAGKLEKQARLIDHSDFKLVHCEEIWIRNGIRVNQMKKHKKGGGDQFIPSLKLCAISPSAAAIEKKRFFELGGFREDYPVCEDYDLWLKHTSQQNVGFLEEALVRKYGGHEDQLSRKFKAMDYWRVKSLKWILDHRDLPPEKQVALLKVLNKKLKVLEQGSRKHGNHELLKKLKEEGLLPP